MKSQITIQAQYNLWANQVITSWLRDINDSQWNTKLVSSFPTIKDTVVHNIGAESIWCDRINGVKERLWIPDVFTGTKEEALILTASTSQKLLDAIINTSASNFRKEITYHRFDGQKESMQMHEICHHVLNHSTYHRGQLITMARQLGWKSKLPSTDILYYWRENASNASMI